MKPLAIALACAACLGVGYYLGGQFSTIDTALDTLAEIAYNRRAETEFRIELAITDSELAEAETELFLAHQLTNTLQMRANNVSRRYEAEAKDFKESLEEARASSERESDSLTRAGYVFGNLTRSLYTQIDLLSSRNELADENISALNDLVRAQSNELATLRNVNEVLRRQNTLLRERVDYISKPRPRHGPGIAFGVNPFRDYQFSTVLGWTLSWS